jgi:hypothetical protein
MQFTKKLRGRVRSGEITCSIRIWKRPHVKVGGRYALEEGEIEVESVELIDPDDIDDALARRSGFRDVGDLMQTAKHGAGENVFLVTFHYLAPG